MAKNRPQRVPPSPITLVVKSLTNKQVSESIGSIGALSQIRLPVRISFQIAKVQRVLDEINKSVLTAAQTLYERYADKDPDGKVRGQPLPNGDRRYTFNDENFPLFQKEYEELMAIANEVELRRIPLSDLGEIAIEPKILFTLDWLFEPPT